MQNPCSECIVLACCKAKASRSECLFIAWAAQRCELYRNYVMRGRRSINIKNANELGELFGYEITNEGKYREKSM